MHVFFLSKKVCTKNLICCNYKFLIEFAKIIFIFRGDTRQKKILANFFLRLDIIILNSGKFFEWGKISFNPKFFYYTTFFQTDQLISVKKLVKKCFHRPRGAYQGTFLVLFWRNYWLVAKKRFVSRSDFCWRAVLKKSRNAYVCVVGVECGVCCYVSYVFLCGYRSSAKACWPCVRNKRANYCIPGLVWI